VGLPTSIRKGKSIMEKSVNAIMPGLCARVVVNEGETVTKGQVVAVINCMKTEFSVCCDDDGVVKQILVKEWDELDVGKPMVVLEVDSGE
jgi:acetyl-CoA carboxylase biotin carboxyl carrier protein